MKQPNQFGQLPRREDRVKGCRRFGVSSMGKAFERLAGSPAALDSEEWDDLIKGFRQRWSLEVERIEGLLGYQEEASVSEARVLVWDMAHDVALAVYQSLCGY